VQSRISSASIEVSGTEAIECGNNVCFSIFWLSFLFFSFLF
jgi:hypothetical protein